MKTPVLAREKGRINDLHVQSNGDSAGQRPFGGQINGVEQGLQDSEITNQAGIQQAWIKLQMKSIMDPKWMWIKG